MVKPIALALAGIAFLAPLCARADISPLANRLIVQQALEDQMQRQLNVQAARLQTQQDVSRANLQFQLQQQYQQQQNLELIQQLNLLTIQTRALLSTQRKPHHHHK